MIMAEKIEVKETKKGKNNMAIDFFQQKKGDVKKTETVSKPKKETKAKIIAEQAKAEEKKTAAKAVESALAKPLPVADAFSVVKFVLMTEKSIQNIEKENKLVFIVDRKATKNEIISAVQSAFSATASAVQTAIDQKGRKKAFVKFSKPGEAGDIAVKLGII